MKKNLIINFKGKTESSFYFCYRKKLQNYWHVSMQPKNVGKKCWQFIYKNIVINLLLEGLPWRSSG